MENNQCYGYGHGLAIQTTRAKTGYSDWTEGHAGLDHRRFVSQLLPNSNMTDRRWMEKGEEIRCFYKKKQLRKESVKKITSVLKPRSISSVNGFSQTNQYLKPPLCELNYNRNTPKFDYQKCKTYLQWPQNRFNVEFAKSPRANETLDWSKKHRKKARRHTEMSESEKASNEESTIDYKRGEKCNYRFNQNGIELKKDSSKTGKRPSTDQTFKNFRKADFEIGKKLGAGNFCTAFLARHKKTGFICAMKIMSKQKIRDQKYEGQIAREITIQSFIKHHNIVELYGVFEDLDNVYLLIEFCSDGHLFNQIRKNSRLEEERTSSIIKGISEAIEHIHHKAIIHRDLKPENIFLSFGVPKVGDFGWAVYQGKDGLLRKTVSGSPLYYSPQIVQKDDYDEKVDIWGIGTIAFECLIGMAPFKVYSLMNLNRIVNDQLHFPSYVEISGQAMEFIDRCLKKRPEERWPIEELLRHVFLSYGR